MAGLLLDVDRRDAGRNQEGAERVPQAVRREVANYLRIPLWTAREWARRGVFPTFRPPKTRCVFVRALTFHRWMEEHEGRGLNPAESSDGSVRC
jgi:hypothetical protein